MILVAGRYSQDFGVLVHGAEDWWKQILFTDQEEEHNEFWEVICSIVPLSQNIFIG